MLSLFLFKKIAALGNKRQLAAISRGTQKERPRNGQSRNTSLPRSNEDYITQLSKEMEGRVTKKSCHDFSKTESSILGALSKLDEYLLNPQIWTFSGTFPGTSRKTDMENQEPTAECSQSYPHPEVEFSACQSLNSFDSDPDGASHSTVNGRYFSC